MKLFQGRHGVLTEGGDTVLCHGLPTPYVTNSKPSNHKVVKAFLCSGSSTPLFLCITHNIVSGTFWPLYVCCFVSNVGLRASNIRYVSLSALLEPSASLAPAFQALYIHNGSNPAIAHLSNLLRHSFKMTNYHFRHATIYQEGTWSSLSSYQKFQAVVIAIFCYMTVVRISRLLRRVLPLALSTYRRYYLTQIVLPSLILLPPLIRGIYTMQCGPTLSLFTSILMSIFGNSVMEFGFACNMGIDKVTFTYHNQTLADGPRDHGVSAWCDSGVTSSLFWFKQKECHVDVTHYGQGVRLDVPSRWIPTYQKMLMALVFLVAVLFSKVSMRLWLRDFVRRHSLKQ